MRALRQFDPQGRFYPDRDPTRLRFRTPTSPGYCSNTRTKNGARLAAPGNGSGVESDVAEREDSRDDNAPASKARLPFHPAADKFPLLSKTELEALAEDIKAHGQHEHIETIDDGVGPMVLDGRNRYNACLMANVEPRTIALSDNTNPHDHLISKNLMRRHLTKLERAIYAARMVTVTHGGDRRSSRRQNGTF